MDDITFFKNYDTWLEERRHCPKHIPVLPNIIDFPAVYPGAKSVINLKLKTYKEELKDIEKHAQEIKKWTISKCTDYTKLDFFIDTNIELGVGAARDEVSEHITRLEKLQSIYSTKKVSSNYINKESVKDIPITDYLEFDRSKKRLCLWHNDTSPSLHYYPNNNSVHCFSCGHTGDIIDVIQQLNGCTFREALTILSK